MSPTYRTFSSATLCAFFCVLILCGFAILAAQRSVAGIFTLADDNSVALFNTQVPANNFSWTVDGVSQLNTQAFWFRVGNAPEQSVHTLPLGGELATNTNFDPSPDTLFVRYNGPGFQIENRYVLDGGSLGSGASDMGEQISITNLTGGPLNFHFFQYADFDLNGTALGDAAVFTNPNTVRQFEPGTELTETVVTPVPAHREIALFPVTLNKLNDGVPSTLSDVPPFGAVFGPGNVTWAYQWDFLLQPGDTFQISKDKNLHAPDPIPEPGTGVLLSLAAGLLLARCRKTA